MYLAMKQTCESVGWYVGIEFAGPHLKSVYVYNLMIINRQYNTQ